MSQPPPPPPPPPHGENPKSTHGSSGLPPGNYDIFIIPPHSSGSGFLYLPSLQPNVNSFAAGFASAILLVGLGSIVAPAVQAWWGSVRGAGGMGMIMLIVAIGLGAWALGRMQNDSGGRPTGTGPQPDGHARSSGYAGAKSNSYSGTHTHGPPPEAGPPPGPGPQPGTYPGAQTHGAPPPEPGPPPRTAPPPEPQPEPTPEPKPEPQPTPQAEPQPATPPPKPTWQRAAPPPKPAAPPTPTPKPAPKPEPKPAPKPPPSAPKEKSGWEKAREETRRREEERKAKEAEQKRKEENERRLKELREKDARERIAREKREQERKAKEAERLAKEEAEKKAKEAEIKAKEAASNPPETKPKSSYAFSATGEKTNPWPRGQPTPPAPKSQPSSPTKRPPAPTAKTYTGTEDDQFSYRPYDKPKSKPARRRSQSSLYSESSYAASHSTSRTTPPPSSRGAYSTKDPDKIVIKAVYAFDTSFTKTPSSQLVSGVGSVTDGLILRITTEGLFIDDDVRGVPQREWDVKAWTMKLVEVWCPAFRPSAAASARERSSVPNPVRKLWNLERDRAALAEEADALVVDLLRACKASCCVSPPPSASKSHLRAPRSESEYSASSASSYTSRTPSVFDTASSRSSDPASTYSASTSACSASASGSSSPLAERGSNVRGASQTGEVKARQLHVLRASIRDQVGRRYVFVVDETEAWKVVVGVQRLRKGTQVRALGVSSMSVGEARGTLDALGW